jgi:hypothetical protein
MSDNNRVFKGVFVPANIWLHTELPLIKKCLLAEIDSLDNEFGCTANNRHFCKFSGMETDTISKLIKSLEKDGWIKITYSDETTRQGRVIKINKIKYQGLDLPPVSESTPPVSESTPPVSESEHKETFKYPFKITLSKGEQKLKQIIEQPLFATNQKNKFNCLTNEEIELTLQTALVDRPDLSFTSAINYLEVEASKKTKKVAQTNSIKPSYQKKEIDRINPMSYNSREDFELACQKSREQGYIVEPENITDACTRKWGENSIAKQVLGARKFEIEKPTKNNPIDEEIDMERRKQEILKQFNYGD